MCHPSQTSTIPPELEASIRLTELSGPIRRVADVLCRCLRKRDEAAALTELNRLSLIRGAALPVLDTLSQFDSKGLSSVRIWRELAKGFLLADMPRAFLAIYRRLPLHRRPEIEFLWKWIPAGSVRMRALRAMLRTGLRPSSQRRLHAVRAQGAWFPGYDHLIRNLTRSEWRVLFGKSFPASPALLTPLAANKHGLFLNLESHFHPGFASVKNRLSQAAGWAPPRVIRRLLAAGAPVTPAAVENALTRCRWTTLDLFERAGADVSLQQWTGNVPAHWMRHPRQVERALARLGEVPGQLSQRVKSQFGQLSVRVMQVFARHKVRPCDTALFLLWMESGVPRSWSELRTLGVPRDHWNLERQPDLRTTPGMRAVQALLSSGADPLAHDVFGVSAFGLALIVSHRQKAAVILRHLLAVQDVERLHSAWFEWAASSPSDSEEESGASCHTGLPRDESKNMRFHRQLFSVFRAAGIAMESRNSEGRTALLLSAYHAAEIPFKILCDAGADASALLVDLGWETWVDPSSETWNVLRHVPWTEPQWQGWLRATGNLSSLAPSALQNPRFPSALRSAVKVALI